MTFVPLLEKAARLLPRLLLFFAVLSAHGQKNLDIFLLIGQSNMSGRGPMIASDSAAMPGVWLMKDSAVWEAARNPLNKYSTLEKGNPANQIGPGFGFATEMRRLYPSREFGLIVNARGGSALKEWVKGTGYYADAVRRARQSAKFGTLKGILWHQGESDVLDTAYVQKLKGFIDSLRKDLGAPNLPFVAGQVCAALPDAGGFNTLILTLPKRVAHTATVKSDGLTDNGDKTHFNRASQLSLGKRFAEQANALVYPTALTAPHANPVWHTGGIGGFDARGRWMERSPHETIRSPRVMIFR